MPVNIAGGGAISVTTTPTALSASTVPCDSVMVQCRSDSASSLLVGGSAGQHIEVEPGEEMDFPISNAASLYVKSASGTASGGWLAMVD